MIQEHLIIPDCKKVIKANQALLKDSRTDLKRLSINNDYNRLKHNKYTQSHKYMTLNTKAKTTWPPQEAAKEPTHYF